MTRFIDPERQGLLAGLVWLMKSETTPGGAVLRPWLAAVVLGCGSSTLTPGSEPDAATAGETDATATSAAAADASGAGANAPAVDAASGNLNGGGIDAANGDLDAGAGHLDTPTADDGSTRAGASGRSAGCATGAEPMTSGTIDLAYGGVQRSYVLHVPAGAPTGALPLVVSLHGYSLSGSEQESLTGMDKLADSEGFLIAYPNGVGNPTDWNAGACCSAASEGDRDDEGFLSSVTDDVGARACVDLTRVYVTGFSNGGMMTGRLACDLADRFAAAATVSGTLIIPLDMCRPSRPIPFMHIHGNADPLVPYDGGAGGLGLSGRPTPVFPAVADEIATFRGADGCPGSSDTYFDGGNAQCDHWGPCQQTSEVVFCTIDKGGHAWPGGTGVLFSEASALDATEEIWNFFKRHTLP
jgi:polyhydroxybutyrate depolymerase